MCLIIFNNIKINRALHLISKPRELEGQKEKKNNVDFALWKKAQPEHIMKWLSPWSVGFPGWHLECSTMSAKYLGEYFDIHGGGLDLLFPHHECEIAQSQAANNKDPVKYWLHNNMITINDQKMSKSLGNFITLDEFFSGEHKLLDRAFTPMTVRFFILQAHYRSTLDFSNEALKAAEKGYKKLINGLKTTREIIHHEDKSLFDKDMNDQVNKLCSLCYAGMNDDFNSAIVIANLFNLLKFINSFKHEILKINALSSASFDNLKKTYFVFVEEILGLVEEKPSVHPGFTDDLIRELLNLYKDAKKNKDYTTVDAIRATLKKYGIVLRDMKNDVEWKYEE